MTEIRIFDYLRHTDMINIMQCAQNRIDLMYFNQEPGREERHMRELSTVKLYVDWISRDLSFFK